MGADVDTIIIGTAQGMSSALIGSSPPTLVGGSWVMSSIPEAQPNPLSPGA